MSSLNKIAYELASRVGEENNYPLLQRLKEAIKNTAAMYIRRDVAANGEDTSYNVRYIAPVSKVDYIDNCRVIVGCTVLRSDATIIKPVRLKSPVPFRFVGTAKGKNFTYIRWEDFKYMLKLKYIAHELFYSYTNNYIYLYNASRTKDIVVDARYLSLELLPICNNDPTSCYTDDIEFPIPTDMIMSIQNDVFNTMLKIPQKDNQINIDE